MAQTPANMRVIAAIRDVDRWAQSRFCLTGPAKSGVTTLLAAWAAERQGTFLDAEVAGDAGYAPGDFAQGDSVAIDNADRIADESWLLNLLSTAKRQNGYVLLAAHCPPLEWLIDSPDLRSRLRSAQLVALGPPDEALMRARLRRATARFRLSLPRQVEDYLVVRLGLSYTAIEDTVIALAGAAGGRRALTVPLAKTALEAGPDSEEDA